MWMVIKEFFLLGLLTFGGGMAMLSLFLDIALRYEWLTESQFSNFIAVSQSTPGPIAINMATFIGFVEGGWLGSVAASVVIVIPGFALSIALSKFLKKNSESVRLKRVISTMKASVLALLVYAVTVLAKTSIFGGESADVGSAVGIWKYVMFLSAVLLIFRTKIPIALYLGAFACLGMLLL